jgi:predicted HicB family RNase H-like nuclease
MREKMAKNFKDVKKGIDVLFGDDAEEKQNNEEAGVKTSRHQDATINKKNDDIYRLSVRCPKKLHNLLRKKCFKKEISINSYILDLIEKDLEK